MGKRSNSKEETLPVIEMIDAFRDIATDDFFRICDRDTLMQVLTDPFVTGLSQRLGFQAAKSVADNAMVGYVLNKWNHIRTCYRFSDTIVEDLVQAEYPEVAIAELNLPFNTFCIDTRGMGMRDTYGDEIDSVLIHVESDFSEETVDLNDRISYMMEEAGKEFDSNSFFKELKEYYESTPGNERVSMIFIKKPRQQFTFFEVVRKNMYLPIAEMPEMKTLEGNPDMADSVKKALFMLLYLAGKESDIEESQESQKYYHPQTKLKNTSVKKYDVGYVYKVEKQTKIQLRQQHAEELAEKGMGSPKRPHMRRGHFHTFRTGKFHRGATIVKWLAPMSINSAEKIETVTIRIQK